MTTRFGFEIDTMTLVWFWRGLQPTANDRENETKLND